MTVLATLGITLNTSRMRYLKTLWKESTRMIIRSPCGDHATFMSTKLGRCAKRLTEIISNGNNLRCICCAAGIARHTCSWHNISSSLYGYLSEMHSWSPCSIHSCSQTNGSLVIVASLSSTSLFTVDWVKYGVRRCCSRYSLLRCESNRIVGWNLSLQLRKFGATHSSSLTSYQLWSNDIISRFQLDCAGVFWMLILISTYPARIAMWLFYHLFLSSQAAISRWPKHTPSTWRSSVLFQVHRVILQVSHDSISELKSSINW